MSNWFDLNGPTDAETYKETEDHIFGPDRNGGKRIGDMTRDELIKVIAMGYYERETLAYALVFAVTHPRTKDNGMIIDGPVKLAKLILDRLKREGKYLDTYGDAARRKRKERAADKKGEQSA